MALQFDVLDVLPDGVIVTDVGAQIQYVNASIERMSGCGRGELVGRQVEVLLTAGLQLRRSDGSVLPVEVTTTVLPGAERVSIVRSVSDRPRPSPNGIGRDVHDWAIGRLFSVGISVQHTAMLSREPAVARRLHDDVAVLNQVIADLRGFVMGLDTTD